MADHLVDREAAQLRVTFKQKHEKLIAATKLFKDTIERLRTQGYTTHATLWNACLYLNMAAHDLSILVEDLALERDYWRRRFNARHLALLAYETTEDLQTLLGKSFRDALNKLGVLSQFEQNLRDARKPLDGFWRQHQAALKQVRTTAAAHRDQDGMAVLNTIENINIDDSLGIGLSLGKILDDLGAVLQTIVVQTSKIAPPEL